MTAVTKAMPTGSAAGDGSLRADQDVRDLIDWPMCEAKSKWSNIRLFFEAFGEHLTWGAGERKTVLETGSTDEDEEEDDDVDDDDDEAAADDDGGPVIARRKSEQAGTSHRYRIQSTIAAQ